MQHLPPTETFAGSLLCAVDHQLTGPWARVQMGKGAEQRGGGCGHGRVLGAELHTQTARVPEGPAVSMTAWPLCQPHAAHRLRITGRGAFLGPPPAMSMPTGPRTAPQHGRWSPALPTCWPGSEAGPGLYGPGVTTPGNRSFQRKRSSKSQPAVDDDMFVEHGVFLQVLTVSRKTGQEQPPH